MGKEIPVEEVNYDGGRSWTSMLSDSDREDLLRAENAAFGKYLRKGYSIIWAMGTDCGRLLKEGPYVAEVQDKTARDEITEMRRSDQLALATEISRMVDAGESKSRWFGKDFQAKHLPQYAWAAGAVLPPNDWKNRSTLSKEDIKFDPKGITIFVKRDLSARKLGIFG